jgi:subtilase family serine protease
VPTGLSPATIKAAYGLSNITFNANGQTIHGDGSGQTIAIIVAYHDPNLVSDLNTFDSAYQLPSATLNQINLAGNQTDRGWAGEETLDAEWAHAIAPGAKIDVVEAKSASTQDLLAAVNEAKSLPGVSVVSMSWGGAETPNEATYDSIFTTPAGHQGITFIAASGDSGPTAGAQWPASSPNVLSVGGTTLSVSSTGANLGESAWSGSGGGYSLYEAEPAYQASAQSSGRRSTPDVAFDADPNTGVSVYTTDPSTGQGGWQTVGGTSVGAPSWAGIIAILDQGLAAQGKGTLDGATQSLPALYDLPSMAFNSVSNTTTRGFGFLGFAAPTSSETSTGLGSPNGSNLINDVISGTTQSSTGEANSGQTVGGSQTGSSGSGTVTTGGSSVGGGQSSGGGVTGVGQGAGGVQEPPWLPIGWWPIGSWPIFTGGSTAGSSGGTQTSGAQNPPTTPVSSTPGSGGAVTHGGHSVRHVRIPVHAHHAVATTPSGRGVAGSNVVRHKVSANEVSAPTNTATLTVALGSLAGGSIESLTISLPASLSSFAPIPWQNAPQVGLAWTGAARSPYLGRSRDGSSA